MRDRWKTDEGRMEDGWRMDEVRMDEEKIENE